MLSYFRMLTRPQLHAYLAALGGWALDALDFFIFVFCLKSISAEFHTDIKAVAQGLFLTLAFRPLGALVFGWLAEKYGRRPILMLNVISYSAVQLATAFAPNLATLLALRALFGFAMGGEWGVGAALALETLPAKGRGFFSGLLQEGYVIGYLLASLLFWCAFDQLGWRGMFIVSSGSALLVMYIRYGVEESPAWVAGATADRASAAAVWAAVKDYFPTLGYLVLLMACFNAFSHGSQDLYPTFLQVQHGFSTKAAGSVAIVMNLGALAGGICFGTLSERLGRKRGIMLAAVLALPMIPLWAWSHTAVMLAVGGFLMQFMVQGAWGIVPTHLNELSQPSVRAILPRFA
jgi:SHS family lactate transporter-like MFS transporter